MNLQSTNLFDQFVKASTQDELEQLRAAFEHGGYRRFSQWLNEFRNLLMQCEESELSFVRELIAKGQKIIPRPQSISPVWQGIWNDFMRLVDFKEEALTSVPPAEREGEWQIIMDNPYLNEGITAYPSLSFLEAAYLYAYFRKDLAKNEYIRLQRVTHLLVAHGSEN